MEEKREPLSEMAIERKIQILRNKHMDSEVKLPFKTTETEAEYSDRVKAVFKSVHIFIYSDTDADVSVIRAKFNEWRKRL